MASVRVASVRVIGLLLAAGAGRRMGGPKALLRHRDGRTWAHAGAEVLREGGCEPVVVVLGAAAHEVEPTLAQGVRVVIASDWAEGMGASLRAGLAQLAADDEPGDAALVALVDTPGVTADVVARLVAAATGPDVLARAAYAGVPGHPVLLGRDHWDGVRSAARGDVGARDYLAARPVTLIECGDVGDGRDIDSGSIDSGDNDSGDIGSGDLP